MPTTDCAIAHKCPYSECTDTKCESYKPLPESLEAVIAAAEHQMAEDGTPPLEYPLAKRLLKALRVSMARMNEFSTRLAKLEKQPQPINGVNEINVAQFSGGSATLLGAALGGLYLPNTSSRLYTIGQQREADLRGALVNLIFWASLDVIELQREGHTVSHLEQAIEQAQKELNK